MNKWLWMLLIFGALFFPKIVFCIVVLVVLFYLIGLLIFTSDGAQKAND